MPLSCLKSLEEAAVQRVHEAHCFVVAPRSMGQRRDTGGSLPRSCSNGVVAAHSVQAFGRLAADIVQVSATVRLEYGRKVLML